MANGCEEGNRQRSSEKSGLTEMNRGMHDKITPEKWAKIAKYATESGIAAAIRHFKTEEGSSQITLKESTVRGCKKLYWEELSSRKRYADNRPVQQLPLKQTRSPIVTATRCQRECEKGNSLNKAIWWYC